MPTYDYECDACSHTFELYQSISAPVETVCPKCKKKKLRRLIGTGGAIVFKGSGFYQTDYRSESYKKSASAESKSGESSSSEAKGGEKKEAKAEGGSSDKGKGGSESSSIKSPSKGKKAE